MRGEYGIIIAPPPYGEISKESHGTVPGIGHRRRGDGEVCSVITTCVDISGVPNGGLTVKVTKPGNNQGALHVQTLESQNRDSTGGSDATPLV